MYAKYVIFSLMSSMRNASSYNAHFSSPSPELVQAGTMHLFTGRPWIQRIARCYLAECGISQGGYVALHVRESPEKRSERGDDEMTNFDEYVNATLTELEHQSLRVVHLQTANPR